jgi:hypothetical protein
MQIGVSADCRAKVQFLRALKVHPEIRGHAEILAETQGGVRGNVPFSRQELMETVGGHFKERRPVFWL